MTTTDSAKEAWERCPRRSRRFVHAAVIATVAAALMLSCNAVADEHRGTSVAHGHYDAGVKARLEGDLRLALDLLRKAWALEQSALIAAKLAQTELELGYYRDAIEHFEFYLQRPEPSPEDRAAVARLLAEAKSKVVVLDIRVDVPGAEILVDGAVVGVAPLLREMTVDPGRRLVEARKAGCTFERVSAEFAPGSRQNLPFTCKRSLPPWNVVTSRAFVMPPWALPVAAGVTLAGLGVGIPFYVRAERQSENAGTQLDAIRSRTLTTMNTCGTGSPGSNEGDCQELHSTLEEKDRFANVATAGFVVAGVGAVGAAVLLLWPAQRHGVQVLPVIKSSESGVLIGGTF